MVLQKAMVWWSLYTLAVEAIEWCPRTGLCLGPLPHSSQELPIGPLQPMFSQIGMLQGLSFRVCGGRHMGTDQLRSIVEKL